MLYRLAIRLGVLITEVEHLSVRQVTEYLAVLSDENAPPDVEKQLLKVFGKPNG